MESDVVTPPPLTQLSSSSPLQFDTVQQTDPSEAAATAAGVVCANCDRSMAGEYYDVNGQPVCDECRERLGELAEVPRGPGVFLRA